MPQNVSFFHGRDKPIVEVEVGTANGRARDFDNRIPRVENFWIWHLFDSNLVFSIPTIKTPWPTPKPKDIEGLRLRIRSADLLFASGCARELAQNFQDR